jgi:hypothetical protein
VAKALFRKSPTVRIREIMGNQFDNFLSVNTPPGIQDIFTKPVTDMPMEHDQFSIYPNRYPDAG